jgi:serine protease Do
LQPGDIVVEVNRKPVADGRELRLEVGSMPPDTQVKLRVLRSGQSRDVSITLGEMPPQESAMTTREKPTATRDSEPRIGISVIDLTPEIREQLELPASTKGIVVADVQEGSLAAEAGLRPGDVIQEVNRKPIQNVSDFQAQVTKRHEEPILLRVNRGGHAIFVGLPID